MNEPMCLLNNFQMDPSIDMFFFKPCTVSDQHCIWFELNHQHSRLGLVRMWSHRSRITLAQRHGQVALVGGWDFDTAAHQVHATLHAYLIIYALIVMPSVHFLNPARARDMVDVPFSFFSRLESFAWTFWNSALVASISCANSVLSSPSVNIPLNADVWLKLASTKSRL